MYYNNYKNKEIIKRICESAKKYKNNLLNKNIIFIFENKKKQKIEYIEVLFLAQNFLHFTGIKYEKRILRIPIEVDYENKIIYVPDVRMERYGNLIERYFEN